MSPSTETNPTHPHHHAVRALVIVAWAVAWTACGAGTAPPRKPCLPCPGCPAPSPAPPSAPLGLLGTADYLEFQTASPEADWAVICQARTDTTGDGQVSMHTDQWGALYGDHPVPYFIHGAGPGIPLDAYILRDATGRHLLVVKDGNLLLLDTREQIATNLSERGAHVGTAGYPYLGHAGASFDSKGTRLLYLQGAKDQRVAVIRDLATGAETRLPHPPRRMRYAYLHHGGEWVIWHTDLKPDHICHFSRSEQPTGARLYCPGRDDERHILDRHLHPCTELWLSPVDGSRPPQESRDVVLISGDSLVVRDKHGALRLRRGTKDRTLVPAACRGRVLGASESVPHAPDSPLTLLVACAGPGPNVKLVTTAEMLALPLTVKVPEKDNSWIGWNRLQRLETLKGVVLVDIDSRPARVFIEDGNLLAQHGRLALFHSRSQLRLQDLGTGRRVLTIEDVPEYPRVFIAGSQFAVGRQGEWYGHVIDLATGRVTGRLPRNIYALSRQGFALVEAAGPAHFQVGGYVKGPLMWLAPVPADTSPGDEPLHRYFWLTPR